MQSRDGMIMIHTMFPLIAFLLVVAVVAVVLLVFYTSFRSGMQESGCLEPYLELKVAPTDMMTNVERLIDDRNPAGIGF